MNYFKNNTSLRKSKYAKDSTSNVVQDSCNAYLSNYDIVEFIISSIEEYPIKYEALFFSLYVLLLNKVFNIEVLYCQEFVDIYCKKRVANEADYKNLYSVMIDLVQDFDNTWETATSRPTDSSMLSNPVYCLAKDIQIICSEYDDFDIQQNFLISTNMFSFLHGVSDKFKL